LTEILAGTFTTMTSTLNRLASVYLVTQLFVTTVTAQSLPNTVQEMRAELDVVNFDLADDDMRVKRLEMLLPHSEALAKENPSNAGFQMMAGFYNAQYAGYAGGIGALKYAKAARSYLEQSVNIDPQLHGASAHVVLGTLYAQVPGWPIGFGDKKKALKNYQLALKLAPNGMDSNFSYARYLFDKKKYAEAKTYLEKAANAPARPDRPKADENVKEQIAVGLEKIAEKLATRKSR
jgi:tetratricopeptide (TPR) repeat protein